MHQGRVGLIHLVDPSQVDGGSSTLVQLVVRLCGIVGGIFATSSKALLIFQLKYTSLLLTRTMI